MTMTNAQTKDLLDMVPIGPLIVAIDQAERDREERGKSAFLPQHCDAIVAALKKVTDQLAEIYEDDIVIRCKR